MKTAPCIPFDFLKRDISLDTRPRGFRPYEKRFLVEKNTIIKNRGCIFNVTCTHWRIQRGDWNLCNFTMQKEKKKEIVIKRVYLFDILFKHVYNVNKHKIVPTPPPLKNVYINL